MQKKLDKTVQVLCAILFINFFLYNKMVVLVIIKHKKRKN